MLPCSPVQSRSLLLLHVAAGCGALSQALLPGINPTSCHPSPSSARPRTALLSCPPCSCLRGAGWTPSRPGCPVWLWVGLLNGALQSQQTEAFNALSLSLTFLLRLALSRGVALDAASSCQSLSQACLLPRSPPCSLPRLPASSDSRWLAPADALTGTRRASPCRARCPPTCPTADSLTSSLDLPRACPPPRARACSRLLALARQAPALVRTYPRAYPGQLGPC